LEKWSKTVEEQNQNANADAEMVKFLVIGAIAFLAALVLVYLVIFALLGGAIYLGAKLGTLEQLGKKPLYHRVHEIEAEKQKHLAELEGENRDLIDLVTGEFENDKMDLYRKDDRPEPLLSINADGAKEVVRKVVKKVAQKITERTK
jgi:hypothetical protein